MPVALCQLSDAKEWLGIPTANTKDDAVLQSLISSVSAAILNKINRPDLLPTRFVEQYNGGGRRSLMLRNWPVSVIHSVTMDGALIPKAPAGGYGWVAPIGTGDIEAQMVRIGLNGMIFSDGFSNVTVDYTGGYAITDEPATISTSSFTASQPNGPWGSDLGVKFASSRLALTKVTGSPSAGQYAVTDGKYTFHASNAGQRVLISYGFTPGPLAHAAMEWAAERYKYRDRIGQRTKSLGGQETVSYDTRGVPAFVADILPQFSRVIPC